MENARVCLSHVKDSPERLSRSVHFVPSDEPWRTQPVGAVVWSAEDVSVYWTPLVAADVGSSTAVTLAAVAEVLSNSAPAPFSASVRGAGTLSSLVIDTGAAFFPVPQEDGFGPMSNSSTAPLEMSEW